MRTCVVARVPFPAKVDSVVHCKGSAECTVVEQRPRMTTCNVTYHVVSGVLFCCESLDGGTVLCWAQSSAHHGGAACSDARRGASLYAELKHRVGAAVSVSAR